MALPGKNCATHSCRDSSSKGKKGIRYCVLCHSFWPGQFGNFESLAVLLPVGEAVGRTLIFLWDTTVHLENMQAKSCFLEHGRINPQQALSIYRNQNMLPSECCAWKHPRFLLEHTYSHFCCFLPVHLYSCLCWDRLNQSQAPKSALKCYVVILRSL